MKTVVYLKNRTIANTWENKTPYKIFFGIKPNVKNLKIYGSRVFVRVPEALRKSKWDNKAQLGVLVGYVENGYKVLVNNKVITARHVDVIEDNIKLICLVNENIDSEINVELNETNNSDSEYPSHSTTTFGESREEQIKLANANNNNVNDNESDNDDNENRDKLTIPRKSQRKKNPVNRYGNPVTLFM